MAYALEKATRKTQEGLVDPINWAKEQALLQSGLLGVKPALLFVVTRGRNAWNSTWVTNYKGPSSLLGSLSRAKANAEMQRVQGSVFTIREVPGLALMSEQGPVGMVEFHSDNCFGKWDLNTGTEILRIGTPLASVLRALGRDGFWKKPAPSEHSFILGRAEWKSLSTTPSRKPLKRWLSESLGGQYSLRWHEAKSDYSRRGVFAIVRAFQAVNDEVERFAAEEAYWAAATAALEAKTEAMETIRQELAQEPEQAFIWYEGDFMYTSDEGSPPE